MQGKRRRLKTRVFKIAESRGIGLTELAKKMGLNFSHIYRVKKGERSPGNAFMVGAKRAFPDVELDVLFYVPSEEAEKIEVA